MHQGVYLETAAAAAGWHRDTLHATLRAGAADRASGLQPKPWSLGKTFAEDPPVPDAVTFSDAVEKARANAEITDFMVIGAASMPRQIPARCDSCGKPGHCENCGARINLTIPGEWTAAAWRLERKDPKKYGRRDRLDVNTVDHEELAEVLAAAAAAVEDAAQALGLSEGQITQLLNAVRDRWLRMTEEQEA